MQKQIIRISKDVREAHKRLIAINPNVPKELPADIEIGTTTITITDFILGTWNVQFIKLSWPGQRIELHVRRFKDGQRSIEAIKIRKSKPAQTLNYNENELKKLGVDDWKS